MHMFNAHKTIFIMVSNTLNPDQTALTESRYMVDVPVFVVAPEIVVWQEKKSQLFYS